MGKSSVSRDDTQSWAQAEDPYLSRTQRRSERGEDRYGSGGEDTYSEQMRRFYRQGAQVVKQQVEGTSVLLLLTAAATAFAVGWITRGSLNGNSGRLMARSAHSRRHTGERSGKPLIESDRVDERRCTT